MGGRKSGGERQIAQALFVLLAGEEALALAWKLL